jgi:glycosyltransferase involved in cell wall biosynthesis
MSGSVAPEANPAPVGMPFFSAGAGEQVEIVVPVRNEERDLAPSVRRLHSYLCDRFPFTARITIADNGSTDGTWAAALALASELDLVRAVRLEQPGRGRALRSIWSGSDADVLAYMDVDLSTDLNALLPLVAPLMSGHSDVAIGTRLAPGARVARGPRREFISRCYNLLLHAALRVRFSDAQCGFKAVRAERARPLLQATQDNGWFFDTELLVLAERAGLRIHEVPVDWTDDSDSRVDVVSTALADLRGIIRLGGGRQLGRFVAVGLASTLAYVLLYLALRSALPAQAANALSLLVTAVANTAVNRRYTFGMHGRLHAVRHQFRGLLAFGAGLLLTSGALDALHAASARPGRAAEVTVLVGANLVATVLRYALYRSWVFRARVAPPRPAAPAAHASAAALARQNGSAR